MRWRMSGALELAAIEPGRVARALIETGLEPHTASPGAKRGILGDGGRDRGQSRTRVIARPRIVGADALIARAARRRNVLAKRDRAAGGAGANARRIGLAAEAVVDTGAADRGAIGKCYAGPPHHCRGEEHDADGREENAAHDPISSTLQGQSARLELTSHRCKLGRSRSAAIGCCRPRRCRAMSLASIWAGSGDVTCAFAPRA